MGRYGEVYEGHDNQNGPKRRQTRRLDSRYVVFFFPYVFYVLTNLYRFYLHFEDTGRVRVC